jgi:excisionase family DNA binding protein
MQNKIGYNNMTENKSIPGFYTQEDVANILKCSEQKVRALIKKGKLVSHRFETSIRISTDNLLKYIDSTEDKGR